MTRYKVISKNDVAVFWAMRQEWPDDPGYHIMSSLVEAADGTGGKVVDGDAFVIRDVLLKHGCKWGKDFYIQKIEEPEAQAKG